MIQLDLTDLNNISKKASEALSICGQIDVLINNGGMSYRGDILSTSIDVDLKLMMVNYFGTIALTKGKIFKDIWMGSTYFLKPSEYFYFDFLLVRSFLLPFESACLIYL